MASMGCTAMYLLVHIIDLNLHFEFNFHFDKHCLFIRYYQFKMKNLSSLRQELKTFPGAERGDCGSGPVVLMLFLLGSCSLASGFVN